MGLKMIEKRILNVFIVQACGRRPKCRARSQQVKNVSHHLGFEGMWMELAVNKTGWKIWFLQL